VNMPRIPTITNHASKNMVENLEQPSLEEATKFKNLESSTQVALAEGLMVCCHCHIYLQYGPMEENHW